LEEVQPRLSSNKPGKLAILTEAYKDCHAKYMGKDHLAVLNQAVVSFTDNSKDLNIKKVVHVHPCFFWDEIHCLIK
jgi:hypothetical protein